MSQIRPADVRIDVDVDELDSTFAQRFHGAQKRFTELGRTKRLLRHMALLLRSVGHLLVLTPLNFVAALNDSVLPVVVYFAALVLFIPVNIALLPFSLCSDVPLAALDACFDHALERARDLFGEKLNIIVWCYYLRRRLGARHDDSTSEYSF